MKRRRIPIAVWRMLEKLVEDHPEPVRIKENYIPGIRNPSGVSRSLVMRGWAVRAGSSKEKRTLTATEAGMQALAAHRAPKPPMERRLPAYDEERIARLRAGLRPILPQIEAAIAQHPGITLRDVLSGIRSNLIAEARRAVIVAIVKARPKWGLLEIARRMGMDHTTVLHHLRRHLMPGYHWSKGTQWIGIDARATIAASASARPSDHSARPA